MYSETRCFYSILTMFNHFQDSFGFQSISVGLTDLAAAQGLPQYFHLKLAKVSFTLALKPKASLKQQKSQSSRKMRGRACSTN